MRIVIQRVQRCSVEVEGNIIGEIGKGMAILLGIEEADTQEDIDWLCGKISRLRIFDDENGVMNLDVQQTEGRVIVISQFTLFASTKKGNRPSYIRSAGEAFARPMYERFLATLSGVSIHMVSAVASMVAGVVGVLTTAPVATVMLSQYRTLVLTSRASRIRVSWVSAAEAPISSVAPRITSS